MKPCFGTITGCEIAVIYLEPNPGSEEIAAISSGSEVMVYESESTDKFYKICTAVGIEGYCPRQFIILSEQ